MRISVVLGRSIIVGLMAMAATFGSLMTGVLRLDWLLRWLGTPRLERPWDLIVFFGPAIVAGSIYFLFNIARPDEARG